MLAPPPPLSEAGLCPTLSTPLTHTRLSNKGLSLSPSPFKNHRIYDSGFRKSSAPILMPAKYPGRIIEEASWCVHSSVLSSALWSGLSTEEKKAVVHNDKARYTHQVPKEESEKEHVCLFRINRENTLSGLICLVLHFPPPLLYIHKQQIGGNG